MDPWACEQFSASVAADGEIVTQITNHPAGGALVCLRFLSWADRARGRTELSRVVNGHLFGYATQQSDHHGP